MKNKNSIGKSVNQFLQRTHNNVTMLNGSKIFAGFMIIVLQISSRFVTIKLSKTMESYLKYTFSKLVLIFAIAWMGTRDIYIALGITLLFSLIMDGFCNEESSMCLLPNSFKSYHIQLAEDQEEEEGNNDITKNIPGMPPTNTNTSNKEGLVTKTQSEKSKIINKSDIQIAMETLAEAKRQHTWKSDQKPFYNT
jgi:hypothetical protein